MIPIPAAMPIRGPRPIDGFSSQTTTPLATTQRSIEERVARKPPSCLKDNSPTFVALLFAGCRPTTVARFIVAVHFNAVKRPVGLSTRPFIRVCGTLSHVSGKILEARHTVIPTITNGDTSTTIARVVGRVRLIAALTHRHPYMKERMPQAPFNRHHDRLLRAQVIESAGAQIMRIAETSFRRRAIAGIYRTNTRSVRRETSSNRWTAIASLACVMHPTQETASLWAGLIATRVSTGILREHPKLILSGAVRTAVSAARPLNYSPLGW